MKIQTKKIYCIVSGNFPPNNNHLPGQFESYLFQRGEEMVMEAIKRCWCSCFSERVMRHRLDNGMPTTGLKMAVIIQVCMVLVHFQLSGQYYLIIVAVYYSTCS